LSAISNKLKKTTTHLCYILYTIIGEKKRTI